MTLHFLIEWLIWALSIVPALAPTATATVPPPPMATATTAPAPAAQLVVSRPAIYMPPVTIVYSKQLCSPSGFCPDFSAHGGAANVAGTYFFGSKTIVIAVEQPYLVKHEQCHAHQGWLVEQTFGPLPQEDNLAVNEVRRLWPLTAEGQEWNGDLEAFAYWCEKL